MNQNIPRVLAPLCLLFAIVLASYTLKKDAEKEKLNKLYEKGLQIAYDKNNPFCPEAEIEFYNKILSNPADQDPRKLVVTFMDAIAYLKLGQEGKAISILESLYSQAVTIQKPDFQKEVLKSLALAYLRAGERANCVMGHSAGSCIFPIQGSGFYTDPTASEKGIKIFEQALKGDSTDAESRWLLNIAYMTIGKYPDGVPKEFLIPNLDKDTSSYKIKAFEDIAGNLKLNGTKNKAGGVIVDDFNNDGMLDIINSAWGLEESMHYYKNNGNNTFTDVSKQSGLSEIKGGLNIIQADYNNDGFTDILVLRGAWQREFGKQPNTLLKNNGDGTFTDVTIASGILSFHPTQTATWADFNNDGWLDLFIGNETSSPDDPQPSELYINNQNGTFSNVTKVAGAEEIGFMKGVIASDYNNDGWPDIFISRLDGGKALLKNKGIRGRIPQFENATHEAGLDKDITNTFPTWFWDYDNDGWPDLFICGYLFNGSLAKVAANEALNKPVGNVSKMYLYHNNHDGTFSNVSKEMGLDRPVFSMGSNFGDVDNDGWLDMYLGTGNPDYKSLVPNKMFKNIDGKKFVDVTNSARVGNLQKGHGIAFADMDNDGDQDIFIEVGGAYTGDAFYNSFDLNPGQNDNRWINVLLQGVETNRSAIGAHIAVTFTENGVKRTVYRDVNSGGSFGASPFRREIGIGQANLIDELIIKWPTSGKVQVFKNIQPDQFISVTEGVNNIEKINLKTLDFTTQHATMNMLDCGPMKQ